MDELPTDLDEGLSLKTLVGYVNFSEGKPDPRFQKQLSEAYRILALRDEQEPWQVLHELLRRHLEALKAGGGAFRDVSQAEAVVSLVFARLLPAYRAHHADLLFHQKDADLWQPFFLARAFEAVLAQGAPWTEEERIVTGALHQLNDFVGHRPLAILETRPQGEPYDHERVRPLPLWIPGAGAAWGRYQEVVEKALEILAATDPGLLAEASFHLELLEELALDPRAYDHGHPVNRRPNYVFGEWDPHHLDNQGRFRRYVVRQGILEALLDRIEHRGDIDRGEVLFEAAAVLAGTILMAAGTSGSSPTQYDSTTSLGTLLPRIARYRDAFYTDLLKKVAGAHGARLQQEAGRLRQPFGGARQHLNQYLTRQRAAQLQQRHLALLFAHMGYPEASRRQAAAIPAASIRLTSEILNRLTTGQGLVSRGQPAQAAPLLPEVEDLVRRGIACGALPDPWNLLGFQGLFPLSPAREDSVRDLRLDELILMLEALFGLYARLLSEAAAQGEKSLVQELQPELRRLSAWWDRFGSVEVSDVRRLLGREAAASAEGVARALTLWHERGQAAGDLAFWRQHLPEFHSPKALALVCDTLLRKQDYRAAMALLIYWLGQVEQVPLENGEFSFHALALRWMLAQSTGERTGTAEAWALTTRFFDYLEANAEDYWQVPVLETEEDPKESAEEEDDLYSAAYADVTYRDSTDDQEDSAVAEGGVAGGAFELEEQAESLQKRLRFLATVARLWQIAARGHPGMGAEPERIETLRRWLGNAQANHQRLLALVDAVHAYPVPEPLGSQDALMEFDRRRLLKEQLVYGMIGTCLDTRLAVSALRGVLAEGQEAPEAGAGAEAGWQATAVPLERAFLRGDAAGVRALLPGFMKSFRQEPFLFVALADGGDPRQILRVRFAQNVLRTLVAGLPRLGLWRETYHLLRTAREMEQAQPTSGRGVSEFHPLFHLGFQAVLQGVVDSVRTWTPAQAGDKSLASLLETLTEPFLKLWMEHSRTLHLGALESVRGEEDWKALREWIRRYGGDLFQARFMTLANLRGLLHRGVGTFLDYLRDHPDPLHPVGLIDDLDRGTPRAEAERHLRLILQAVVENYEEYKDYNSSTTQSDYGENLYLLLDFLLLKTSYERRAWQFRPLALVHEVLARHGRNGAALLWQEAFTRFSAEQSAQHLERLGALEQVHGMCLRTIRDRLEEQFTKPLALDRLCALIQPAMEDAAQSKGGGAFAQLEKELGAFTAQPAGSGLDVPHWLRRLEQEVHKIQVSQTSLAQLAEDFVPLPHRQVSFEEVQQQIQKWDRPLEEEG